jgi:hypothetical protein
MVMITTAKDDYYNWHYSQNKKKGKMREKRARGQRQGCQKKCYV